MQLRMLRTSCTFFLDAPRKELVMFESIKVHTGLRSLRIPMLTGFPETLCLGLVSQEACMKHVWDATREEGDRA